jgi:hypothetical protein
MQALVRRMSCVQEELPRYMLKLLRHLKNAATVPAEVHVSLSRIEGSLLIFNT